VARGSHARSYRHRSCLDVRVLRCGRALLTHEPACSCHAAGCMGERACSLCARAMAHRRAIPCAFRNADSAVHDQQRTFSIDQLVTLNGELLVREHHDTRARSTVPRHCGRCYAAPKRRRRE
jgi:hypothetical protein